MHKYSDLLSGLRDYKLKVINNELKFDLIKSFLLISDKLDFIINTFPNDVISGSMSLYLLGLINREPNDIDIIIPDKNRYDNYLVGDYDDEIFIPNRLGVRSFKYKKNFFTKEKDYEVDFFENKNVIFLEFIYKGKLIKIHNPVEVIQLKLDIIQNTGSYTSVAVKHSEDLNYIFKFCV